MNTLRTWMKFSGNNDNIEYVITCDIDDVSMNNAEMMSFMDTYTNLKYHFGKNNTKVEAINANIPTCGWDIMILASDDMLPIKQGYDEIIINYFKNYYPELDGALWLNDGLKANRLCTLPIMGMKLYMSMGYIYNPAYRSVYCDNEFTDILTSNGKLTWIDDAVIKHSWKKITGKDELFLRNEHPDLYKADLSTYKKRKMNRQ